MTDRQPTPGKEGRVRLTFDDGSVKYARVEMADDPLELGDPLNKATLLKDATAALYGLGTDAVPDDVLKALGGVFIQECIESSTSWTVPDDLAVNKIHVMVFGGGGGGNGGYVTSSGSTSYAGGGGGGGHMASAIVDVSPGQSFNVIIGAGGNSGVATGSESSTEKNYGEKGGTTSFGDILTALGGNTDTPTNKFDGRDGGTGGGAAGGYYNGGNASYGGGGGGVTSGGKGGTYGGNGGGSSETPKDGTVYVPKNLLEFASGTVFTGLASASASGGVGGQGGNENPSNNCYGGGGGFCSYGGACSGYLNPSGVVRTYGHSACGGGGGWYCDGLNGKVSGSSSNHPGGGGGGGFRSFAGKTYACGGYGSASKDTPTKSGQDGVCVIHYIKNTPNSPIGKLE